MKGVNNPDETEEVRVTLQRGNSNPRHVIRFGAFFGQSDEFRHGIQVECDFRKLAGERKKLTDGIRPASTLSRTV